MKISKEIYNKFPEKFLYLTLAITFVALTFVSYTLYQSQQQTDKISALYKSQEKSNQHQMGQLDSSNIYTSALKKIEPHKNNLTISMIINIVLISLWSIVAVIMLLWKKNLELNSHLEVDKSHDQVVESKYIIKHLDHMSHELRTPLNSLLILAEELAENKENNLSPDQIVSAKNIHESGFDLLILINNILNYASVKSMKRELNPETIILREFAESINNKFSRMARSKNINFAVQISHGAPLQIFTDRLHCEQIIWKLLSNALHFTREGTVRVKFSSPAASDKLSREGLTIENSINISIEDSGTGINEEYTANINKNFKDIANTPLERASTYIGTGLSISSEFVHMLGGEINLQSTLNKGTTFTIILPKNLPENFFEDNQETIESHPSSEFNSLKNLGKELQKSDPLSGYLEDSILIIEDDEKFRDILIQMVETKNIKAHVAGTGLEGIDLATKHEPKAIILDMKLPDINGMEVITRLRDKVTTATIPIYVMSIEDRNIKAIQREAIGFLTKPVSREQLHKAFEQIQDIAFSKDNTILIVEDNEILNNLLKRMLVEKGISVQVAFSGEEALIKLKHTIFDCIILDLGLPEMSGLELLDTIAEDKHLKQPPVIVYTGKTLDNQDYEKLQKYTNTFISKSGNRPQDAIEEIMQSFGGSDISIDAPGEKTLAKEHIQDISFSGSAAKIDSAANDEATKNEYETPKKNSLNTLFGSKNSAPTSLEPTKTVTTEINNTVELPNEITKADNKIVLLVDDDKRNTYALSRILHNKGFKTIIAENGKQALDVLNDEPIDIVLMDIMMPVMNGYEAIGRIREQQRFDDLPVLAITAKAMDSDKRKCLNIGANGYISKPVDKTKLFAMMDEHLVQAN